MLDSKDALVSLADTIQRERFAESFAKYYSKEGKLAKPIRLMVGLLILKQLENLSDENSAGYLLWDLFQSNDSPLYFHLDNDI